MSTCRSTCPYCGVGCGVVAEYDKGKVIAVRGDADHPANAGRLCVKGSSLAETMVSEGRVLHPYLNSRQIDWDAALNLLADKLRSVREEFGSNAIAFYLSGQLLTEDYYVANKLMKGFLGSANVDTNSRLCMSSAVAGYQRAFGADYVPCSYEDLESCDLLVMVGSNAAWTHPVLYQRIVDSRRDHPHKRIVVIDPRRTATCDIADLHLGIKPGSDGFLYCGLLHYLISRDHLSRDYIKENTAGFEEVRESVQLHDVDFVAERTGLSFGELEQFYQLFAATEKTVTFYSQGINQSATGTDKCNAIINCHLATGRLGKPGMGPFSITGQPNAMGGREVGGMANHLAAHMDFRPEHRDIVARFWQAPDLAPGPGLKAVDMFQAAADGKIRFLWIMATNPAVSIPDTAMVRRALDNCDFVVVSDCVGDTDTAGYADLLLPAAGWGEKEGTVTNSERCISRQRKLLTPVGEARPDWWIVTQVAQKLGFGEAFDYDHPADIFVEHASLSGFENAGSRDFDIAALDDLSRSGYEQLTPIYWPQPRQEAAGSSMITTAGDPIERGRFFTESRRAQFVSTTPTMLANCRENELQLNTGRLRDQWHTMTRTGRVARLMRHRDFFSISFNREDALARNLVEGDLVELSSHLGSVTALVSLDSDLTSGQVFSPIHWSGQFSGSACISSLIEPVTDRISGQPQSKFARVRAAPVSSSCWGVLLTRTVPALPSLAYWSRVTVTGGYLTLFAGMNGSRSDELCSYLLGEAPFEGKRVSSYADSGLHDYRYIGTAGDSVDSALFVRRHRDELPSQDWLIRLLGVPATPATDHLLAGEVQNKSDIGRLVCTCEEVGEQQIVSSIAEGASSLDALGAQLRCGTQCGSCIPELKCLLQLTRKNRVA